MSKLPRHMYKGVPHLSNLSSVKKNSSSVLLSLPTEPGKEAQNICLCAHCHGSAGRLGRFS